MNSEAMAGYKKIILYFIKHLELAPTTSQITDFLISCKYVTYFHAQQALYELTEDGYLEKTSTHSKTSYNITGEGLKILEYSPREPSRAIKEETLSYIKEQYGRIRIEKSTPADYRLKPEGGYLATLSLTNDNDTILSVSIGCPDEATAQRLCLNWPKKCPDTYALLVNMLLDEPEVADGIRQDDT